MSQKTIWVQNPKGIKVALPERIANWRLAKFPQWKLCEPESVPAQKQYPATFGLSEEGKRRRNNLNEVAPVTPKESMMQEIPLAPVSQDEVPTEAPVIEKPKDEGRVLGMSEYNKLAWPDLKKYAASRGVFVGPKTTKREILDQLDNSN
jgi:hypothetical protein